MWRSTYEFVCDHPRCENVLVISDRNPLEAARKSGWGVNVSDRTCHCPQHSRKRENVNLKFTV